MIFYIVFLIILIIILLYFINNSLKKLVLEKYIIKNNKLKHSILDISDDLKDNLKIIVIGDVHGCFDELQLLLKKCGFKENKPNEWLVIFVGDIINKGPKNFEVLDYIMSLNNSLCVKGNHEYKVLKKGGVITDGKESIMKLTEQQDEYLQNLPLTMRIPAFKSLIVHAGIIPGIKLEEQNENDLMNMRNIKIDDNGNSIALKKPKGGIHWADVWNSYVEKNSKNENSLSYLYPLIIYGHDAKRGLQIKPHSIGLDSRCVYGGYLTGYLLHSNEFINIKALKTYVKNDDDLVE
jgi:hypothetical protein